MVLPEIGLGLRNRVPILTRIPQVADTRHHLVIALSGSEEAVVGEKLAECGNNLGSMSYFDNEERADSTPSRSSNRSRRSAQGSSYTDRFRTDVPFAQPSFNASQETSSSGNRGSNGGNGGEVSLGQILALVDRAVSASHKEPDLYLNLQVADLINEKKGNAAREVAIKLAKLANSNFAIISVLALSVLDVCVKNCGYPFHLAISRRDFLNLLVRKFPEKPPLQYTRVQTLILEMIEEWNVTLVKSSRYRDDLGFIRDMHRLLSYKGYMFPEISADELAALTPEQDTLKSAAELEREDREAQSAKLQELIRSGSPQDLKEANRLMSIMAGFRETRVDYHAKVAADLDKVRRKASILSEMLQQVVSSGSLPKGGADDVFNELTQSLKAALPKIRHILADEEAMEDDEEAKEKVLSILRQVESVLTKHAEVTGGDTNVALKNEFSGSPSKNIPSLIDIGDDGDENSQAANQASPQDDLLGLSFGALTLGPATSGPMTTSDILKLNSHQTGSSSSSVPSLSQHSTNEQVSFAPFSINSETKALQNMTIDGSQVSSASEVFSWSDESLSLICTAKKSPGETQLELIFSNPSSKKVSSVEIQLAPPKSLKMEISPLTSTELDPHQPNGIHQRVILRGGSPPKLRWKVSYNWGIEARTAGGDIKSI